MELQLRSVNQVQVQAQLWNELTSEFPAWRRAKNKINRKRLLSLPVIISFELRLVFTYKQNDDRRKHKNAVGLQHRFDPNTTEGPIASCKSQ